MSSPFSPAPKQQPPKPENRLPEWVTNKPKWFWIVVFAAIWFSAMIIKPIFWPTSRGRDDFVRPIPGTETEQTQQNTTAPAVPDEPSASGQPSAPGATPAP